MFTLETTSSLPFTTKSTLQALLKSREQVSTHKKLLKSEGGDSLQTFSANDSDASVIRSHEESLFNAPTPESGLKNADQNGDFSYSQKLFHIADGNLYSIFSPLQGRSYGMKPSFLRKQRCTVQECHGRGRKALKKGLKFHNFLPSESITSEKDSSFLQDQWKVHSECKLREEHGTKQIMVSNWFQSIKQPTDECLRANTIESPNACTLNDETVASQNCVLQCNNGNLYIPKPAEQLQCGSENEKCNDMPDNESLNINFLSGKTDCSSVNSIHQSSKNNFLNSLLHSVAGLRSHEKQSLKTEDRTIQCMPNNVQKHRRKPNQTRRVVPYMKYLSIMEENEAHPLDLSMHVKTSCAAEEDRNYLSVDSGRASEFLSSKNKMVNSVSKDDVNFYNCISSMNCDTFKSSGSSNQFKLSRKSNDSVTSLCFPKVPAQVHSVLGNDKMTMRQQETSPNEQVLSPSKIELTAQNILQCKTHFVLDKKVPMLNHNAKNSNHHVSAAYGIHPSNSLSSRTAKPRRKSQRSVIKQKLEDTFKQNGFLVKTKQVSDGEATFCKFRQLRKYTRYYLKSWQHHLPDEVHKMWKGFLPPKTVLPSIAESVQAPSEENT